MSLPKLEQYINNGVTALNGAIDDNDTTLTVDNGAVFPSVGNFRIRINDEILLCTARSTHVLTVERGAEGTTPANHADDDTVTSILTAASLKRLVQDDSPYAKTGKPKLGSLTNSANATLAVSDFTWVNQGSTTATDQDGNIYMEAIGATGQNIRALVKSAPSAPYTIIAALIPNLYINGATGSPICGICFRESSSGKLYTIGIEIVNDKMPHLTINKMGSATSLTSSIKQGEWMTPMNPVWFKIEDDNTNTKFYFSANGRNWILARSESRTAFLLTGPNQVGFFIDMNGSNDLSSSVDLVHWSES